ncbi:MAG: OmpA family protein [Gemmatimonadales bacterium]
MRRILLLAGALATYAVPTLAQEKGTVEIGAFGRFTKYDGSFSTSNKSENSFGGGGRLGYFFSPKFSLELDGSFNATDLENYFVGQVSSPIRYWPFHLRGLFHAPLGEKVSFLIGPSVGVNYYGDSPNATVRTISGTDMSVGGLAGFRFKVNNWLSLRLDGTADYMPSPANAKDEIAALNPVEALPSSNLHLGAQLGLSIFPNPRCTTRLDGIDLLPNTASVQTGQSVNFNVTGRLCDGSSTTPQVTYSVSPAGTIGPNGVFSSSNAGTYQVIARTLNGKLADTSTVTVTAPPPPPPPPTLSRVEINPKTSTLKPGESATYTVTGYWSDGNSRAMRADECSVSAQGNPTASAWTYSWSRSGEYQVTATCSGSSDRATATVRGLSVTLRAMFGTNRYSEASQVDRMSLDQVAEALKADQNLRVYIDGHTDWRNTVRYNNWLGQRRAETIQRELVRRGVARNRTVVRSFGECRPVGTNETEDGMAQNRRVEVSQIETAEPEAAGTCAETGPAGVSRIGRPGE